MKSQLIRMLFLLVLGSLSFTAFARYEAPLYTAYADTKSGGGGHFATGAQACAAAASYQPKYGNPRLVNHPNYGWGCMYDLTNSNGSISYDLFFQNWATPIGICPNGHEGNRCYTAEIPPHKNAGSCCDTKESEPQVGNPITVGFANKFQRETDYRGPTLAFERYYNSALYDEIGKGWQHSYQATLGAYGSPTSLATVHRPDGRAVTFVRNAAGQLQEESNDPWHTLTETLDANNQKVWFYTDRHQDSTETYNAAGRLVRITPRNGQYLTLEYDANYQLIKVSDLYGRSLQLTRDSQGRLSRLTDPAGQIYDYAYGAQGSLISVTYPAATEGSQRAVRQYHYENSSYPAFLTGITDENGWRFATYTYDMSKPKETQHHVTATTLANRYLVNYVSNYDTSVVTDPLGTQRTYKFQAINGVVKNTSITQSCSGCSVMVRSQAYDTAGNITQRTDFRGLVTIYEYDLSRNLEISHTEASGTAQARTITTEWHPTFALPTSITEPGRITTYSYDSNGNPLSKTVTAGSASQVWTWTYNSFGQVLTEDGPRTDVSDVTTYAYYDSTSPYYGSLASVTNAAGQITQFTAYDANGNLLTQIDANGVTTTLTYDARSHLISRSSNSKVTSYEYAPVGQLTKVTLPDGNWVSYVYDPAHRLTEIHDKAGNKIVYTLDAMSRRTREEVQDMQGGFAALLDWIKNSLAVNSSSAPAL